MRINIEIGDIEAFIELTETNSFAKAATNLNPVSYTHLTLPTSDLV